jgi:hypothetical protein
MMQGRNAAPVDRAPDDERRYNLRAAVLWTGSLECAGQVADCILLNVGVTGAMVRMAVPFERSLPVTLRSYHFGDLSGRVIWQDGNAIGVQFEEAPDQVIETLGRALPELTPA